MYKKILIATDGSDNSLRASRHGIKLAKAQGAEAIVIYVINEAIISSVISAIIRRGPPKEDIREQLKKSAALAANEVVKMGEAAGVKVEPIIREGDPAGRIVETARMEDADLIVMGSHGEGGISSKLIGSVAQKVLNWAEEPVMVVR